jgi:hypothetical protein
MLPGSLWIRTQFFLISYMAQRAAILLRAGASSVRTAARKHFVLRAAPNFTFMLPAQIGVIDLHAVRLEARRLALRHHFQQLVLHQPSCHADHGRSRRPERLVVNLMKMRTALPIS